MSSTVFVWEIVRGSHYFYGTYIIFFFLSNNTCREDGKERIIKQKHIKPGTVVKLNCHRLRKTKNFKVVFYLSLTYYTAFKNVGHFKNAILCFETFYFKIISDFDLTKNISIQEHVQLSLVLQSSSTELLLYPRYAKIA